MSFNELYLLIYLILIISINNIFNKVIIYYLYILNK
uniref:Uncharacterized protein n=1 Tax=viral metagenome TaxID=1070528 RepID=A0A6C0H9R3_9ZZZZ